MNPRWPEKTLEEVADLTGGSTPSRERLEYWDGEVPWVTPTDLPMPGEGIAILSSAKQMITKIGLDSCAAKLLSPGTVLFSSRATIGKLGIITVPMATNQGFVNLSPKPGITSRFLAYSLWNRIDRIKELAGSTTFKEVSRGNIKKFRLAVPPLPEQERIVGILDATEELRYLRKKADRRTADLIPALFHEMFGDREESATKTLGEIVQSVDSGWSPVCRAESAATTGWGVLKLGAVTTGTYLDSENKALPEEEVPRPGIEVKLGDILFTRKNTKDLVAAVAYVWETRPKLLLSDLIFRFRPKIGIGIEPIYLAYALKKSDKRREIQALASGAAGSMPNISKQRLSGIKISVPPLSLQRTFADRVAAIRAMEVFQATSRSRFDDLFQSLLHRAFRGGL